MGNLLLQGICSFDHRSVIAEKGFFYGYTEMTYIALCLLAFGGLLVSIVITRFDNITKVYVTCVSIFTTSVFSYYFFEFQYNITFALSVVVVSISILVYNDPSATLPPQL
jgi:UDP-sugar transporter A1/2/3